MTYWGLIFRDDSFSIKVAFSENLLGTLPGLKFMIWFEFTDLNSMQIQPWMDYEFGLILLIIIINFLMEVQKISPSKICPFCEWGGQAKNNSFVRISENHRNFTKVRACLSFGKTMSDCLLVIYDTLHIQFKNIP